MNRKRSIEVWASMTDMLLLLVIVGFAVIMVVTQSKIARAENGAADTQTKKNGDLEGELTEAIKISSGLKTSLESSQAQLSVCGSELEKALTERKRYEGIADDRAKSCLAYGNAELEKVIDQVEQALKALSAKFPGVLSSDSQSVSLSSEILTYPTNGHTVDSRNPRLDQFIDALCASLEGLEVPEQALIVEVVGQTDEQPCLDDPNCNWIFSTLRAGHLVKYIQDRNQCNLDQRFILKATGIGVGGNRSTSIYLRPNYDILFRSDTAAPQPSP